MLLFLLACSSSPDADPAQAIAKELDAEVVSRQTVVQDGTVTEVVEIQSEAPLPSLEELQAGCDAADPEACLGLGWAHFNAKRYEQTEAVWLAACKAGNIEACGELAYQYTNPQVSFPGRQANALEVGTRACDEGTRPISCATVAGWYERGDLGLEVDLDKARALTQQACDKGHYWSCEKLK